MSLDRFGVALLILVAGFHRAREDFLHLLDRDLAGIGVGLGLDVLRPVAIPTSPAAMTSSPACTFVRQLFRAAAAPESCGAVLGVDWVLCVDSVLVDWVLGVASSATVDADVEASWRAGQRIWTRIILAGDPEDDQGSRHNDSEGDCSQDPQVSAAP